MYWVNGSPAYQLDLRDRSIHYGDGFFTTCQVKDGKILLFEYHWQRLQNNAQRLKFYTVCWESLSTEMDYAAKELVHGVLKVILTRGNSKRGYLPEESEKPIRIMMTSSLPAIYNEWRRQGITLMISQFTLARQPFLAGIKHLNRLEQVLIKQEIAQSTAQEAVVLDTEGYIVECCTANIFWRNGRQVYTPVLLQAGVVGVMRQYILTYLMHRTDYTVHEVSVGVEALGSAEEVLICNALMGIIPINSIAQWNYSSDELYRLLNYHCRF